MLINNWILVVQGWVCLIFCVAGVDDDDPREGFRGFPVVSVGRSAALHLDADAPSGLFSRVKTRVSAAFALRCGFSSSDVVFWDYFVCFQACVTEFADFLFVFSMRCVFLIVIRQKKKKKIDKLLIQHDLFVLSG